MVDWTERYRPATLEEIRGNNKARDQLHDWAQTWSEHREPVVLHGEPGVGKTSAAHALAADMEWAVVELNASDARTRSVIEDVVGEAATSGTLEAGGAGRRLLILDEADNFHGNADRGGSRAVTKILKTADQPVVLIANEYYELSRTLRNRCQEIEFRSLSTRSIVPVLRDICRKEGIEFEEQALKVLAERADGDLRSAINDLQVIAESKTAITEADIMTGTRDQTVGVFPFLDAVLQEATPREALQTAYDVDETPDELLSWIEDNVPKEYTGTELTQAFRHLATADRWLGRVYATQEYSFWRYATDAMTAGVAASRSGEKHGWTRYQPPQFRSKLGRSSGHRAKRDDIARRVAERSGTSIGTARRSILPFLEAMIHHCRPKALTIAVAAAYDLDEADVAFITGSGADTNKVGTIIETAAKRREESITAAGGAAFDPGTEETPPQRSDDDADEADQQAGLNDFM